MNNFTIDDVNIMSSAVKLPSRGNPHLVMNKNTKDNKILVYDDCLDEPRWFDMNEVTNIYHATEAPPQLDDYIYSDDAPFLKLVIDLDPYEVLVANRRKAKVITQSEILSVFTEFKNVDLSNIAIKGDLFKVGDDINVVEHVHEREIESQGGLRFLNNDVDLIFRTLKTRQNINSDMYVPLNGRYITTFGNSKLRKVVNTEISIRGIIVEASHSSVGIRHIKEIYQVIYSKGDDMSYELVEEFVKQTAELKSQLIDNHNVCLYIDGIAHNV